MSILTPSDVAPFLNIDPASPGLQEAINQAEALVAGKMQLPQLDFGTYEAESQLLRYNTQQIIPRFGPIRSIQSFTYAGDDITEMVTITGGGWSMGWAEPFAVDFDRIRGFARMKTVTFSYTAGWTNDSGAYPLPVQVAEYVKVMTGLTYNNLLGSGVYDTKLGDMTIKIQREVLARNLQVYDEALRPHARP